MCGRGGGGERGREKERERLSSVCSSRLHEGKVMTPL